MQRLPALQTRAFSFTCEIFAVAERCGLHLVLLASRQKVVDLLSLLIEVIRGSKLSEMAA